MTKLELIYSFIPFYPESIKLTELAKKSKISTGSLTSIITTVTIEYADVSSVYAGSSERYTRVKY